MKKVLSKILIFCLALILLVPSSVFAQKSSFEKDMKTLNNYIKVSEDNVYYFDREAAQRDNQPELILKAGEEFELLVKENDVDKVRARVVRLEIYGNWCGPGYSGPEAPIDALDTACQSHDYCYGSSSSKADQCNCDQKLISRIYSEYDSYSSNAKSAALAIASWFSSAAAGCRDFD